MYYKIENFISLLWPLGLLTTITLNLKKSLLTGFSKKGYFLRFVLNLFIQTQVCRKNLHFLTKTNKRVFEMLLVDHSYTKK